MHFDIIRLFQYYLGHDKDISKVIFNPQGTKILTAGYDQIARLWDS